ncbi:hypothetical protein NBRC116590_17290 [Pelagimonas sp. KU-00592-HH]|uniref:hypothetical protein n=1 Tax=Pelagimonas sp. KU-00592-HH TaxID=3127651 RepID=UPI0031048A5D
MKSNVFAKLGMIAATASASIFTLGLPVFGAGHFISGLQGLYPEYDLNDAYVFQSTTAGHTSFILSTNPSVPGSLIPPTGANFGAGGLYNLHIATDEQIDEGITYVFSFQGDEIQVSKLMSANADIGATSEHLANGTVGEAFSLPGGVQVWAGRGVDPFFGNGVGLAGFNAKRQAGTFSPEAFQEGGDLFAEATASFIVLDVPNELLSDEIRYFTSTAVVHNEEWHQIDRLANVLFPYVFFADTPAVQEDHQQHRPDTDVSERRQAAVNNVFMATSLSGAQEGNELAYAQEVADVILPDVITYKTGTQASYTLDAMNGRALHDDAMNTVLNLMNGLAVDDQVNNAGRYGSAFPYILAVE